MGYVSKCPGPDRTNHGEAGDGTQRLTQRRLSCQAIRRRPSGTSPGASRQPQRDPATGQEEMTIYQLTDRLHGRTECVHADHIAATVASWLAELDAWSPLVELLGRAVRDGDWPAIHAIGDYLSVEVQVAA